MRERQAVKLSGVSTETEQRGTVETITVAEWSDRGGAHTRMKMQRQRQSRDAWGPVQTSHKHVRRINGCTPVQDPNTLLRPRPLRGATSISACNHISAAVFEK